MIKQTWNVSGEEKNRILNLHEAATKNLYLVKEQQEVKENFTYLIFQPETGQAMQEVNWELFYVVVAVSSKNAYVAEVVEKTDKNYPISFKVDYNRPLPYWLPDNVRQNQFKFSITKTNKKSYDWDMDSDIKTKNSLVFKDDVVSYYAVITNKGNIILAPVTIESPSRNWGYEYDENSGLINFDSLEDGSSVDFVPSYNVLYSPKQQLFFGLIVATTFGYYRFPGGKEDKPTTPPKITQQTPVNFGDSFADNISYPSGEQISKTPEYQKFVKFVKSNDMSKYKITIQSSASKCKAGNIENKGNLNWQEDKSQYPDVVIDTKSDKNDIGNLNLTKARAQHFKDFLISNLPELKNAKFNVIAQGSKGSCGSEEENKRNRIVSLTYQEL
jgi:hypothetical protein